ncbi:drug resistance transporter, EmrB/QacA subfamily [Prosthecobacter debontii]|uniref:Drug resistance transporter, EmrB/QacA subfamily n=1 Tax=Prosthecobacter debontii TaxID=48467 RepID=A0A1T4YY60_9BACT|nr:DHA2 family efflux MFS transporter permease subunit [Prosthecobacter debontii]SKB06722.1 drug resistance transporter, EmrB/QacA subfamily [Prosthecobacter debontii]
MIFAGQVQPPERSLSILPWLVAVALFMEQLDATILNTAVPTMSASLGVEPLSLKSVLTSYTLSLAVFIPISGWMADRFGTKRVFSLAIVLFTLGSLLCAVAVNPPMLVVSRVIQGMGGAMMMPVGRIALVRSFPRSEMLRITTYVIIPALIGPLIGPSLGGAIIHWFSWRVIFLLNVPFALVGLWLARAHMPDFRDPEAAPLDKSGFFLFGSGIALLSYVLEVFGEHTLSPLTLTVMTLISLGLLYAYWRDSLKTQTPLLAMHLFGIRTFRVSVLGGFITRLGVGGMPFLLPLLYQIGLGFPPWQAGLLTIPLALAAIGMKVISRPLLAKFGHRQVLIVNTVLLGVTITLFTQVQPGTSIWMIVPLSFTQGFFSSLQFTSMNTLVFADVEDREASKASSIASTGQQMSASFGVAFASMLAAWFLGNVNQTDASQVVPALHHAFITMGSLTILSSATFWGLKSSDGDNVSKHHAPATAT